MTRTVQRLGFVLLAASACAGEAPIGATTTAAEAPPVDRQFTIQGLAGKCVELDRKSARLVIRTCDPERLEQRVRVVEVTADHLVDLRIDGECVQPGLGISIDGNWLETAPCTGLSPQRWMLDGDSIRAAGTPKGRFSDVRDLVVAVATHSGAEGSQLALVAQRLDESDYWEMSPTEPPWGYPTSGFVRVTTAAALVDALDDGPGTVIDIPAGASIDMTEALGTPKDCRVLPVGERVTIRSGFTFSGRRSPEPAARLWIRPSDELLQGCHESLGKTQLFHMVGAGARVTGLQLQGASTSLECPEERWRETIGIGMEPLEPGPEWPSPECDPDEAVAPRVLVPMTVDHVDAYGWKMGAINVWAQTGEGRAYDQCRCFAAGDEEPGALVARSYIHENDEPLGYGVSVGGDGRAAIVGNTFLRNRHAVAGSGDAGQRYHAADNLVLLAGAGNNSDFDIHGTGDNDATGGAGGERVWVTGNTFMGTDRWSFRVRGTSCDQTVFRGNVTRQWDPVIVDADGATDVHLIEEDNQIGRVDLALRLGVGDFDGDGSDDLLLATGATWYVSFRGATPWQYRASGPETLDQLLLGDFDGDRRTDVVRRNPTLKALDVRWGGEGDWQPWRMDDVELADLLAGDFDGDGVDDLLRTDGETWHLAARGTGPWSARAADGRRAPELRAARMDPGPTSDVFGVSPGSCGAKLCWTYRPDGGDTAALVTLGPSYGPVTADVLLADMDGNGRPDVVRNAHVDGGTRQLTEIAADGQGAFVTRIDRVTARLGPVGRFDSWPGADVLLWREHRDLDVVTSGTQPPALHNPHEMF